MKARWRGATPAGQGVELIPPGWFELWVEASLASDPSSAATGVKRAVNGPVADIRDHWSHGLPVYDPGEIRAPVLLVHGEWDIDVPLDAAEAYFLSLRNAHYRRWVEIGEATHMVLLERQRMQAFRAISGFLTEAEPTAA